MRRAVGAAARRLVTQHRWASSAASYNEDIEVRWRDMDRYGHVNNTRYLEWMEVVRCNLLHRLSTESGLPGMDGEPGEVSPIVGAISIKYIRPVTWPDTVTLENLFSEIKDNSCTLNTRGTNTAGDVVFIATCKIVMVNYTTGKRTSIPSELESRMREHEGDFSG
eukprot:TRINITY_DN20705_c0_g1_i1.p1 TRINITY_DN20705_c0_g1~~TRINITY_DN20705_c0_g1_i1.p1  ORF type:complete len:165 (+),score=26.75 TRINITY_DN20705_c0_g1_i1:49-543(+)